MTGQMDDIRGQSAPIDFATTGTLAGDIQKLHDLLAQGLADVDAGGDKYQVLDPTDPFGSTLQLAAYVSALNAGLIANGYYPPEVDPWADPMGFFRQNIAFLASIIAGEVAPAETSTALH